jgi:protein-S-isoprenylcysteine O-methyltransferase Ste14
MASDQTFRLALLIIVLLEFPIAIFHRLRSHAPREPLDRRQEGWFILLTLRPLGLATWTGVIAFLIDPSYMSWSSVPLPAWARWAGVGVSALGGALMTWTLVRLGPNLTDTVVTRREHALVTRGPYRFVRHPFYDAAALFVLGIALLAANRFLFVAGGAVVGLLVLRTRTEEGNLLARFGAPYREYLDRTGRFLPNGSGWKWCTLVIACALPLLLFTGEKGGGLLAGELIGIAVWIGVMASFDAWLLASGRDRLSRALTRGVVAFALLQAAATLVSLTASIYFYLPVGFIIQFGPRTFVTAAPIFMAFYLTVTAGLIAFIEALLLAALWFVVPPVLVVFLPR